MDDRGGRGLAIEGPHGPVRLKWHKLRRKPQDFPFDRDNLKRAVREGASCEVDLRRLGDGNFACLHDAELDRETNGTGSVVRTTTDRVKALRLRHPHSGELGDAPALLQEVSAELVAGPVHRDAVVQLDMKDDELMPSSALDHFAAALEGCAHRFIAGGMSWPVIAALGRDVPGLRLGFDPLQLADEMLRGSAESLRLFGRTVVATARDAEIIYLSHELIAEAADLGVPIVEMFRSEGLSVDCWTLDPDQESIRALLPLAVEMGVDQITTNAPLALEVLWRDIAAPTGR